MFRHSASSTWKPSPRERSLFLTTAGQGGVWKPARKQPSRDVAPEQGHGGWEPEGKERRCWAPGDQLLEARAQAGRVSTHPFLHRNHKKLPHPPAQLCQGSCTWPRAPVSHLPPCSLHPTSTPTLLSSRCSRNSRGTTATQGFEPQPARALVPRVTLSSLPSQKASTTLGVLELHEGERTLPALCRRACDSLLATEL